MACGGPRSSCVRPGAHSALRQDSRNDLMPCHMTLHFVSAGAHAPHSYETPGPTATRGSSHSARRLTFPRFPVLLCGLRSQIGPDQFPPRLRPGDTITPRCPVCAAGPAPRLPPGHSALGTPQQRLQPTDGGLTGHPLSGNSGLSGKLTQLPTSPFVVKSGLPITA